MQLTNRDRYMIRRARDLQDELTRLKECLKEAELQTIGSPNMDGMPHGSGDGDAMTRRIIRKDKLGQKIRTAERALKRSKTIGGKALRNVKAPLRMFCEAYFFECASFEESCAYAGICKRTGDDYRKMINKEDE